MQNIKKTLAVFSVLFLLSNISFAQSSATGNATVSISVKPGLSVTNETGDIVFDDVIIVGSSGTATKSPDVGARFRVDGHKSGNVSVTFNDATLSNSAGDNLTFVPNVDYTGGNSTYAAPSDVTNGDIVAMDNSGSIYLWVGGDITYDATTPVGDYSGTFTLNIAY